MKIGVISDIHAQYDNLMAAVRFLRGHGVDGIVCAGDLVEKGDDGDRVVRTMRNVPTVLGNHDEAAISNQAWFRREMNPDTVRDTLAQLDRGEHIETRLLSDTALAILEKLPFQRTFTVKGINIQMVHGSPKSNVHYIFDTTSDESLRDTVSTVTADILICGHTHTPLIRWIDDLLVLNPGAVMKNPVYPITHTCGILTLPEKHFAVYSIETGEIILTT
ncbi:MAG: YfcE family phosphodiesterase [Chloroflexota bacterium]